MKKAVNLDIKSIENKINYTFKDKALLVQAFTRTSFCNEVNQTSKVKYHSNEVLEFFGDGVLSLSIISFLLRECTERYEHGIKTELGEGDFSNIKSKLSDKQNLSKSMKALGLEKHLLMGEGDLKLNIQNEPSVMEDLFESIVGAIFIDSDMNIGAVIKAVSSMLDMSVYTDRQKISQSAKNALQEWCADKKRRLPAPRYETLSEDGPDHKKTYMRGCYIGDKLVGRGIGKNFKLADAAAAEDALKVLMAQYEQKMQKVVVKNEQNEVQSPKTTITQKTNNSAKTDSSAKASTAKNVSFASSLKNYATAQKIASPTFRDLGEKKVGKTCECSVECCFMGKSTLGVGATRLEARESASELMLAQIKAKSTKVQSAKTKPSQKTLGPTKAQQVTESKAQKNTKTSPTSKKKKVMAKKK